ncbi:MAG: hypothetical protein BM557_09585 [Flavobacterium sp. MedPE-SWcel]|mgnify:CR=1 FL=1|uniref:hypothetical protein n=1 Tax=uncultured Flavobacterium sp. TaxID=165435 RepID=UPI0009163807|nr:hypothetical protein [uncultured Flavobacterium sp.]OIQ16555.1 MAG: hypothetical protein BM557_09585 [Flavobacterium sp. MedPE-SWcel]
MKPILTIVITFLIAFATSLLFEIPFINDHPVRYTLVVILVFCELIIGLLVLKEVVRSIKKEKE